jgi:TubC N-terminal docking domain
MLTCSQLVEVLKARDIKVAAIDDRLCGDAPKGAVTRVIADAIRRYRDDLLAVARLQEAFGPLATVVDPPTYTARVKDGSGKVSERVVTHTLCPCDRCGRAVLLDPAPRRAGKLVWPRCYLTPGCGGRHREDDRAAS